MRTYIIYVYSYISQEYLDDHEYVKATSVEEAIEKASQLVVKHDKYSTDLTMFDLEEWIDGQWINGQPDPVAHTWRGEWIIGGIV
jgi:hypothetical protein